MTRGCSRKFFEDVSRQSRRVRLGRRCFELERTFRRKVPAKERGSQGFDCFLWVCGGEADAESCGVARHGRVADGGDEEAGVDECVGGGECCFVGSEDVRDDWYL